MAGDTSTVSGEAQTLWDFISRAGTVASNIFPSGLYPNYEDPWITAIAKGGATGVGLYTMYKGLSSLYEKLLKPNVKKEKIYFEKESGLLTFPLFGFSTVVVPYIFSKMLSDVQEKIEQNKFDTSMQEAVIARKYPGLKPEHFAEARRRLAQNNIKDPEAKKRFDEISKDKEIRAYLEKDAVDFGSAVNNLLEKIALDFGEVLNAAYNAPGAYLTALGVIGGIGGLYGWEEQRSKQEEEAPNYQSELLYEYKNIPEKEKKVLELAKEIEKEKKADWTEWIPGYDTYTKFQDIVNRTHKAVVDTQQSGGGDLAVGASKAFGKGILEDVWSPRGIGAMGLLASMMSLPQMISNMGNKPQWAPPQQQPQQQQQQQQQQWYPQQKPRWSVSNLFRS